MKSIAVGFLAVVAFVAIWWMPVLILLGATGDEDWVLLAVWPWAILAALLLFHNVGEEIREIRSK